MNHVVYSSCPTEFDGCEWNEAKSQWNLHIRGFDFEYASRLFDEDAVFRTVVSKQMHGEARYESLGLVEGRLLLVIWTRD